MKIIGVISMIFCIILWIIAGGLVLKTNKGNTVQKMQYIITWLTLIFILIIRLFY